MFQYTSREQAYEFLAHVRAREPFRLQELAQLMSDSGGPVGSMDASPQSLVELWPWFLGFARAGCPGVPIESVPATWPGASGFLEDTEANRCRVAESRRRYFANESVQHYLRLVCERAFGSAAWAVLAAPLVPVSMLAHGEIGVVLDRGRGWFEPMRLDAILRMAFDGVEAQMADDALLSWSERVASLPRSGPRGESVLVPLLSVDLGEPPELVRVSPVWSWPGEWWKPGPSVPRGPRVGQELVLAAGTLTGLDAKPWLLAPLDEVGAARALNLARFCGEGGAVLSAADLLVGGRELGHRDEAASVLVQVHGGRLRALYFEPDVGVTQERWDLVMAELGRFARSQGAMIGKEDDFGAGEYEDDSN
ncbi:hypothetical protein [Cellulomonas composti]|uniref:Uncharacterized protein n=1 Tax=Cellulomonas composti TaxID=266130 RepID=A0A511JAE1_9CELL|nr:hypothetical protein [Cellulomonas composti]GEL94956.1 hypothetical protein CCO02nite_16140 [Cellulomonas composti]